MTTVAPASIITNEVKVDVLHAAANAVDRYPGRPEHARLDLPTIASNRDLTLDEVKTIVERHGWPKPTSMRRAAALLERDEAEPAPAAPTEPASAAAADEPPVQTMSNAYVTAVPITKLIVDRSYQRDLDERRIQRMAAGFDVALVGILEVHQRDDGTFAILDGQHRWAAFKDHAFETTDPHMVCRVHSGLTITEEAALYHQLNTTRRQLTGWDRWVARRTAGEMGVLDIETTAHRHSYRIGMKEAPGVIRATKACENVVVLGGINLFDNVLTTIRAAYKDDQTGLDASIIHGIGHVMHSYDADELDVEKLIQALVGILPRQLTARAAAMRELHKGTMDRLVAHVTVERYNALPGRRLEPFFDRVKPVSKSTGDGVRRNEEIRLWAKREGIDLPPKAIPRSVREAYNAVHGHGG